MKITIVGGGNIGTQFAAHCAEKKHEVTVFTSRPLEFSRRIDVVDEENNIIHSGIIKNATDSAKEAFEDSEIIFITVPAFCMKDMAEEIQAFVKPGVLIGLIPGTGGGEYAFSKCLEKGAVMFGLQRVPSVARLVQYGKSVRAIGYRDKLHIASLPGKYTKSIAVIISDIFDINCECLPCYLNLTLTPSNPILHTTRLKTIFENYSEVQRYERVPLFYEEWSDKSSKLLLACDEEVQKICRSLIEFDLSGVVSLKAHYDSSTPAQLTKKIRSIAGFKGIETPVICCDGMFVPDFDSRYFLSDFAFGLSLLEQIAGFYKVDVPKIREVMDWYRSIQGNKHEFSFSDFGITDRFGLYRFYSR